ncbi:MAG: hypothetical protein ACLR8Y_02295 [Alistipes indistinctus]
MSVETTVPTDTDEPSKNALPDGIVFATTQEEWDGYTARSAPSCSNTSIPLAFTTEIANIIFLVYVWMIGIYGGYVVFISNSRSKYPMFPTGKRLHERQQTMGEDIESVDDIFAHCRQT